MIYMRGQASDYDHWRQLGNTGWGWDDVLPYFLKSENHHTVGGPMHGSGGEWKVSRQRLKWDVLSAFQEGAKEFGIEPRADFNDGDNEGSGFFEVNQRRGLRWNASKAFLRPALKRPNLRLVTHAHVDTIVMEGCKATGIRFVRDGLLHEVFADREVLLAAGAIHSPKLLEHSGIGRPNVLRDAGIEIVHESPGVGENLQDHLQIRTAFKVTGAKTLNTMLGSPLGKVRVALQYALTQSGPMSMAPSQFGMFTKSDPAKATPDLEYHVQPLSTDRLGDPLHPFPAITVSVCNLRPESVGSVHVKSCDTLEQPEIRPNYLSTAGDRDIAVRSIHQARRMMTSRAMERYRPEEFLPGIEHQTDEAVLEQVGNIATTIFHPVGTCKMGNDGRAVVGTDLTVHGIDGLRVIDASIMPRIVSGNTASPVVMIAEKAAAMIRAGSRHKPTRSGR
jgi:choline dehydrogenase